MGLWMIIISIFADYLFKRKYATVYWMLMGWCSMLSSHADLSKLWFNKIRAANFSIFPHWMLCLLRQSRGPQKRRRECWEVSWIPGNRVTLSDAILKENLPLCAFVPVHLCTYLPLWLWCTHSFLLLSQRRTGTLNPLESISLIFYIPAFHYGRAERKECYSTANKPDSQDLPWIWRSGMR